MKHIKKKKTLLLSLYSCPCDAFFFNWCKLFTYGGPICLAVTLDQIAEVKFEIKAIFVVVNIIPVSISWTLCGST